jgi:hypothetical protein
MPRWRVILTLADGTRAAWRRGGGVHTLSEELGPTWVANFQPRLFQALPDGHIVPRGEPGAVDIATWALEAAD